MLCFLLQRVSFASAKLQLSNSKLVVCFTPGQRCTALIVKLIRSSKRSIYMQAYGFTSYPIARALASAQKRGVKVKVIVDVSQLSSESHSRISFLLHHNIKVKVDDKVDIAHNKVLIVDGSFVETGSFNYTYSAEHYNAENVLIVHDSALALEYLHNWNRRERLSKVVCRDDV